MSQLVRTPGVAMLAVATSLLALSACSSDSEASEDGTTAVNMAFEWTCEGSWAPVYSGLEEGIFSDHGIDLTYDRGQGGSDTVPLVAAGEFDLGQLSAPPVTIGAGQDLPLTVIGAAASVTPVSILADPSIQTPEDLEGKSLTVQTDQFEGAVWEAFVEATGIDADSIDVIPSDDATQTEFMAGEIDAMVTFYNTASTKAVLDERPDLTVIKMQEFVPAYGHVFVANDRWLAENEEGATEFVAAWAESTAWVIDNKEAALATLTENCAEVDPAALEFSLDAYLADYQAGAAEEGGLGALTLDGLAGTQEVLVDAGLAEEVPVEDYATTDHLPETPVRP